MKRFALPILLALSIIVSTMPVSSASVTPGAKCSKVGAKQTFKGKIYACIKLGSKLYWNNGVKVVKPAAKPTPSPSPTKSSAPEIVNELAGLTWMSKSDGAINLSLIMKSTKSNYAFVADGLNYQTSFPNNFTPLDIWQDKIIACPSYCLNEFYIADLKGGNLKQISLDKIQHPDLFTYSLFKGANFGKDSRYVFALTQFNPVEGVNSVLYRIDTLNGVRTPVYTTYCYVANYKSCAYGYRISSAKVSHKTDEIAIAVEAIGEISAGFTSSYVMTIIQNAGPVTLKSVKNVVSANQIYYEFAADSQAKWRKVNNVVANQVTYSLSDIQFLDSGELLYIKTAGEPGRELNQVCVLTVFSKEDCDQVSPFKSIYELTPLGEGKVVYQTLDFNSDIFSAEIFDLESKVNTPITNFSLKMNFQNFSIG
jgi:hypothetical protein